eukprot:TRINITY_DN12161_c0_g1_i2.p1 TRINITY_DN12161_c0_g1~~TRINITY_DN12161_c0_g1_i2.p1  ORF type:complete len:106 (-),score=5.48 TRINITY_DN12161_c0_g1_i2:113-430(-)
MDEGTKEQLLWAIQALFHETNEDQRKKAQKVSSLSLSLFYLPLCLYSCRCSCCCSVHSRRPSSPGIPTRIPHRACEQSGHNIGQPTSLTLNPDHNNGYGSGDDAI